MAKHIVRVFALSSILVCSALLFAEGTVYLPSGSYGNLLIADDLAVPEGLAVDLGMDAVYSAYLGKPYIAALAGYSYGSNNFEMAASFYYLNDGKHAPSEGWMSSVGGGLYLMMNEGYTKIKEGALSFTGGYLRAKGTVDTPYDALVNGNRIGSLGADLYYENGGFTYESRWICVNMNSIWTYGSDYGSGMATEPWADRGVNYRAFSYDFGKLRLGYEESAIYLGRSFDALYFLSPMPAILTNTLVNQAVANPWVEDSNDGCIMGLFGEYRLDDLYLEAQFEIDDINIPYFIASNEDKFAWSLGGKWKTQYGTFSFYHGGATQYTYEATYGVANTANVYPYQYTYYPLTSDSGSMLLDITDNSIGFMYGENSLAFKVGYQNTLFPDFQGGFALDTAFEYVLNGEKSPDNPWGTYESCNDIPYRIGLFNGDSVLEQRLIASASVAKSFGEWKIKVGLTIGEILNCLGVESLVSGEPAFYVPQDGTNRFVFEISLAGSYRLKL
jgi:hypothetical protein